jgi:hypothetical protein
MGMEVMMLRELTIGTLVVAFIACLGSSDATAEPYSFQNIQLGIDLDAFRALEPQTRTSPVNGEAMQETKAFCSGDKLPQLDISITKLDPLWSAPLGVDRSD